MLAAVNPDSALALAADIGGTQIRAALVTRDGEVQTRAACATEPEKGIDDAARRLAQLFQAALDPIASDGVVGLGAATAGPLNPATGTYHYPPNLPSWHGKSLKPLLEQALGVPVCIGHDATLAALAETQFGDRRGVSNLIYVTVSTGVGGGLVANGDIVTGANGGAGEVGHITIRPEREHCTLEDNASGPAIARLARERVRSGSPSTLAAKAGGDPQAITAMMVFDAAAAGDEVAREVVLDAIDSLGIGLGTLLNIFDPEALVLGGGVVTSLHAWWDELRAAIRKYALPRYENAVPLQKTTLGGDIGLLGAAELAFRRYSRR